MAPVLWLPDGPADAGGADVVGGGSGDVVGPGDAEVAGGAGVAGGAETEGAAGGGDALPGGGDGTAEGGAGDGTGMIPGLPGAWPTVAGRVGAFVRSTTGSALGGIGIGTKGTRIRACDGAATGISGAVPAGPAADSATCTVAGIPGKGSSVRGAMGVAPDRLRPNAPV
jgi:hypothetical protein